MNELYKQTGSLLSQSRFYRSARHAFFIALFILIGAWIFGLMALPAHAEEDSVRNLVTKWLNSWKSGDMKTYGSCYSSDFQSYGINLNTWVSHRADVYKKSKNINISIDDLQISADENSATAVFIQNYSSSISKYSGKKTLELKKINNKWKIYKEIIDREPVTPQETVAEPIVEKPVALQETVVATPEVSEVKSDKKKGPENSPLNDGQKELSSINGKDVLYSLGNNDYLIAPEDKLTIIVWEHNDLQRELSVSVEGNISFPLIGEIKAAGKTTSQIENHIAKKLSDGYIVNPQVTVTVLKFSGKQFFIVGEIKNPGKYDMEPGMNVLKAITMGGGLSAKAAPKRTSIIRIVNGKEKDSGVTMDTVVKPGDTIIVPESFF